MTGARFFGLMLLAFLTWMATTVFVLTLFLAQGWVAVVWLANVIGYWWLAWGIARDAA